MAGRARSGLTDEFWRRYRAAAGLHHDDYDVVAFGDGPSMATELAKLTVAGIKRATARDWFVNSTPTGGHRRSLEAMSSCSMAPIVRERSGAPPRSGWVR